MHSAIEYFDKENRMPTSRQSPHQNFKRMKNGEYKMVIGSIEYPERYTLEQIPYFLELRDTRRAKQGMNKAKY